MNIYLDFFNNLYFSGDAVACYSACMKSNTDEYYCRRELFTNYVIITLHITETPVVASQIHALQTSGMWTILIRCLRPTVPRPTVMPMMTTPQLSFVETLIMISFSVNAFIYIEFLEMIYLLSNHLSLFINSNKIFNE